MEKLKRKIYSLVSCRVKLIKMDGTILKGYILNTYDEMDDPQWEWKPGEEALTIELASGEIIWIDFKDIKDVEQIGS